LEPACAKACPTGAIRFGTKEDMLDYGSERVTDLKERGYAGKIYQTHGIANNDFLRVGGKDVEGTLLPAGPVLVAAQLPADHPVKKSAQDYIAKYEAAHGKGTVST
ncbi:formate dehydrogenase subunit beta, partial [Klebsiella variicola]|nr:formate dehydrogenase subunit beta [Klebsiella variicola]